MLKNIFYLLGAVIGVALNVPSTYAATLGQWEYTADSYNDSLSGDGRGGLRVGGTPYEVYGSAYKVDAKSFYFAVNTNLPREGAYTGQFDNGYPVPVRNNSIVMGDLLLNFATNSLNSANGSLRGIRFAPNNDAGVFGTGIWNNVSSVSVANDNAGWRTSIWANNISDKGGVPTFGALSIYDPYFGGNEFIPTVIASGTKAGEITLLDSLDLQQAGFDTSAFPGIYNFGFQLDRSLLPEGDFTASLFYECFNDGTAFRGSIQPVPVPPVLFGIFAAGLFGANKVVRRKKEIKTSR